MLTLALAGADGMAGSPTRPPEGLIVARNGDLYATSLAGDRTVRLTKTGAWETAAAVSADGTAVAYQRAPKRTEPPELWTMSVDGSRQAPLGVNGGSPTWAPDGKSLYFTRSYCCEICANIWRVSANGRGAKGVTRKTGLDRDPAVSPDGRTLAFETGDCQPGFPCCIVAMNLATRRTQALPGLPDSLDGSFHPTWAPDGKRIAFNTGFDDPSRIYVARADGSDARPITRSGLFADSPEWSPDGLLIAMIGGGSEASVHVVRPDGTGLRRVWRARDRVFSVDWLPRMPPG
jgi:Tol biopolymer transport system component